MTRPGLKRSGPAAVLVLALVLLNGCAGELRRPACQGADIEAAVAAALDRGSGPLPSDLACVVPSSELQAAWRDAACRSAGTWRIGLAGGSFPEACESTRDLLEGLRLGLEYGRLIEQLRPMPEQGPVDPTQVRLVRERDVIRGIAQLRGWRLPDGPASDAPGSP